MIFSQYITHHRKDLFDNPDSFVPERWENVAPSAYEYLPFGAGPRMCIGASLAMMELRTALAVILKRFHVQMSKNAMVNGKVISTMLGPTSSVPVTLIPTSDLPATVPISGSVHDLVQLPPDAQPTALPRAA